MSEHRQKSLRTPKEKKLEYFQENLKDTIINKSLLGIIHEYDYLCLWTSSVKERAVMECRYFNINYNELVSFDKNLAAIGEIEEIIFKWLKKYNIQDKKDVLIIDDEAGYIEKIKVLGYQTLLVKKM